MSTNANSSSRHHRIHSFDLNEVPSEESRDVMHFIDLNDVPAGEDVPWASVHGDDVELAKQVRGLKPIKRPDWLPEDYRFKYKYREGGLYEGRPDFMYTAPTGDKFRSKVMVMQFEETGRSKQMRKFVPKGKYVSSKSTSKGNQGNSSVKRKRSSYAF